MGMRCLGRDLGPSVINIFSVFSFFPRTSGNDIISILALSDHRKDASGTNLCLFWYLLELTSRSSTERRPSSLAAILKRRNSLEHEHIIQENDLYDDHA